MKQKDNKVHLYGFLNEIKSVNEIQGKKSFLMDVATVENWKDNTDEWKKRTTYHTVSLLTDDKKVIKNLEKAKADLDNNMKHLGEEGFEPKTHTVSLDGSLTTKENIDEKGVKYYNPMVVADGESFKLDAKRQEKEVRNRAELKGNIANIDMKDGFAKVSIATHFYAPGASKNYKGEEKEYTEVTRYIETKVDEKRLPKTFAALKNGELAVGDLVSVNGQMHNNRYTEKETGIYRDKIDIDLKGFDLIAKKGEKKAQGEEKTEKKAEVKKETKKAAPKKATPRKKGVSM